MESLVYIVEMHSYKWRKGDSNLLKILAFSVKNSRHTTTNILSCKVVPLDLISIITSLFIKFMKLLEIWNKITNKYTHQPHKLLTPNPEGFGKYSKYANKKIRDIRIWIARVFLCNVYIIDTS